MGRARTPSLRRAVRPLAASEPSGLRIERFRRVWFILQNLAWLNVLCSVSKVFMAWLRGRSPAVCISHRRPNPSVKRTVNSGPLLAVFGQAVPLLSAAYLIR